MTLQVPQNSPLEGYLLRSKLNIISCVWSDINQEFQVVVGVTHSKDSIAKTVWNRDGVLHNLRGPAVISYHARFHVIAGKYVIEDEFEEQAKLYTLFKEQNNKSGLTLDF